MLNEILFVGRASRARRALIEHPTRPLMSEVDGWLEPSVDDGIYWVTCTGRPGVEGGDLLIELDACIKQVQQQAVGKDEVARAVARGELALCSSLETAPGRAALLGFAEAVVADPAAAFTAVSSSRFTRPGDLLRVARQYLRTSNRIVVKIQPGGSQ
jgi:predicted Zn-dependent peptidase